MRLPLEKVFLAAVAMLVAAVVSIVLYILIPVDAARQILGMLSMILIVLSGAAVAILSILGMIEVLASKNDNGYKAIWTLAILFLGILGFAAYYLIARKDLK